MKIYSPTHGKQYQALSLAPRSKALEGQTWGFVDTSKVNADLFIEEIKAEAQKHYQPKSFIVIRKESPGVPLTPGQIEQLAGVCGFIVLCFGD